MTRYRCREHQGEAVTWRGTGCWRCAADARRRKRGERNSQAQWFPDTDFVDTSTPADRRRAG